MIRWGRLTFLVATFAFPRAGMAQSRAADSLPAGVTVQMIADGKQVYAGHGVCYACHGQEAVGGMAPSLADTVWLHSRGEYDKILATILAGVPAGESKSGIMMPARGGSSITDDEARAVAAYIWSLSGR
ncbi:MAG: c-type cytochrome [Gemmatimonadota bacterium]